MWVASFVQITSCTLMTVDRDGPAWMDARLAKLEELNSLSERERARRQPGHYHAHTLHRHEAFSLSTYGLLSLSLSLPLYVSFSLPFLKHSLSAEITVACCLTLYSEPAWQAKSGGVFFIHAFLLSFFIQAGLNCQLYRFFFLKQSGFISSINHN